VTETKQLKKQIEKLTEKAKASDEIPKKDQAIKVLNDKLNEYQKVINDLKDQLEVFSGASNMMDDLIMQKMVLEQENQKLFKENHEIKSVMETTELIVNELENGDKISKEIILEKENQIINLNTSINCIKEKVLEFDRKEKAFEKVLADTKTENKIMREELGKMKNVNVDELLEKNVILFGVNINIF